MLAGPAANPMGVDWFAMVFGLGFVLSFGYWCTNFLVVQRAMAANNMTAARNTPLVAAVPKMFFPLLVILPGMIAVALASMPDKNYRIPPPIISQENYAKAVDAVKNAESGRCRRRRQGRRRRARQESGSRDKIAKLIADNAASKLSEDQIQRAFTTASPKMITTASSFRSSKNTVRPVCSAWRSPRLLASFMSGMAGNVTAFNTVLTYDLYQAYFAPDKSDAHYFWMGKVITVVGILLSMAAAYFASIYNNAMDIIQLVFGFVNAPLFATFLLGMFWKRATGTGAFLGLFGGIAGSALFHALTIAARQRARRIKGGYLGVVQNSPAKWRRISGWPRSRSPFASR